MRLTLSTALRYLLAVNYMNDSALLVRPTMPTTEDETRARHQAMRWRLLVERWDDDLLAYLGELIDERVLQSWGQVDTAANPIADICRQLSTPGLYGRRPTVRHTDARAETLVGAGGVLDRAGWYSRGQHLQYLTIGLGNLLVRFGVKDDRLTYRFVLPFNVWVRSDPDEPERILELRELRVRQVDGRDTYVWDAYQIDGTPSYRVLVPSGEDDGRDVTQETLGATYEGESYPWRKIDGSPCLPFVMYTDQDTGATWNHWLLHGLHRGTLNVAKAWTFAAHCAQHATGSHVMVWGLKPPVEVAHGGDRNGVRSDTVQLDPGAIAYHQQQEGVAQPGIVEIGPGVNLPDLLTFAQAAEARCWTRLGINPDDVTRKSSNPSSAAALMVSNQGKREKSAQYEPIFRRADLEAIACAAMVLRAHGLGDYPEEGYEVIYYQIPTSASEQSDRRDEQDWELDHGLISLVDVYLERHPGSTREAAIAQLARVAQEQAAIAAAGVAPALPPTPPVPPES